MNPLNNPTAIGVDNVLIYIFGISLLMLVGITVTMIYFVIKYRRSKYPQPTSEAHGSVWLEITWTVLPTLIVMTMFWYGWVNYLGLRNVPKGALEIKCTARQWSWQFEYPDGRKTGKLYVPVGQPIKVNLHSVDVLHSFFVPAFRIKRDVVPGMESYVWFKATEPGSYDIFCAEYCGTGHSKMVTTVEALSKADYAKWAQPVAAAAEPRGLTVLKEKGCTGCHSLDGSTGIGPSLFQLAGRDVEVMTAGQERKLKIDADYLRRSIRDPKADVVEGFQPIMPPFGKDQLSDADLQAVIDYLLGKTPAAKPAKLDGRKLLEENGCLGCHTTDGSKLVGPSFLGIGGSEVEVMRGGQELKIRVDADYLRRSILDPKADIVEGYPPIMPAGNSLSKQEVDAIVEYLLHLKAEGAHDETDHQ